MTCNAFIMFDLCRSSIVCWQKPSMVYFGAGQLDVKSNALVNTGNAHYILSTHVFQNDNSSAFQELSHSFFHSVYRQEPRLLSGLSAGLLI